MPWACSRTFCAWATMPSPTGVRRTANAVRLTPVGEGIVAQAQKVLEQAQGIRELAQAGKNQLTAPLKVGAIYTVGPYLFPHLIPQLHRVAPQMPLYIEENFTHVLRDKLRNGELDAIIIAMPFNEADVLTLQLYDEPFRSEDAVVHRRKLHPRAARQTAQRRARRDHHRPAVQRSRRADPATL